MYTDCTIKWVDTGREMNVTIKSTCDVDDNDDEIFFYGYDRYELLDACKKGKILEGEWMVVSVGETYTTL